MNKYFKINILILAILSLVLFACKDPNQVTDAESSKLKFKTDFIADLDKIDFQQGNTVPKGGIYKSIEIVKGAKLDGSNAKVDDITKTSFKITFGTGTDSLELTLDNAQLAKLKDIAAAAATAAAVAADEAVSNNGVKIGNNTYLSYVKAASGDDLTIKVEAKAAAAAVATKITIKKEGLPEFKKLVDLLTDKATLEGALEKK